MIGGYFFFLKDVDVADFRTKEFGRIIEQLRNYVLVAEV